MKTRFFFSIQNNGDGSASLLFFESAELARLDQDYMEEGWGESCDSFVDVIHPDGTEVTLDGIITAQQIIEELMGYYEFPEYEHLRPALESIRGLCRRGA